MGICPSTTSWATSIHAFGETVMARLPQSVTKKFAGKLVKAIWLGKAELSDGAFICRTTHRIPEAGQFDKMMFDRFFATPWDRKAIAPPEDRMPDPGPAPRMALQAPAPAKVHEVASSTGDEQADK